jgi:DNA-binding NtrC family response regulator
LVVEDDPDIAIALEQLFVEEGYRVALAVDLCGARAVLESMSVSVVLLDMRLANGDHGGTLVAELADDPESPPVVLVSASPELAGPLARKYGLTWLPKPFDLDAMIEVVRVATEMTFRPQRTSVSA